MTSNNVYICTFCRLMHWTLCFLEEMRKIANAHLSLRHEICIEVAAATNTRYIYASDDVFDY